MANFSDMARLASGLPTKKQINDTIAGYRGTPTADNLGTRANPPASQSSGGGGGNRSNTRNTPTGGGVPNYAGDTNTTGFYPSGWQTPIGDPGAALRNTMRQMGVRSNPFNQSWNNLVNNMAAGLLPQFFAKSLREGAAGQDMGLLEDQFGKFIQARMSGQYGPMGINDARTSLGDLNSTLRQVTEAMMGLDKVDMTTPEGRAKAIAELQARGGAGVTPLQMAIASQMLNADDQAAMFLGAYLPGLGPSLSRGLAQVIAPQQQAWKDYLGATYGPTNKSFLDILTGSMNL